MTCRMNKTNVIPSRIMWDRLVDRTLTLYEYDATNDEEFLASMERLGYDREKVLNLMENKDA